MPRNLWKSFGVAAALVLAAGLLSGCNGSNGDDPDPPPGPIGPVNASQFPGKQAEPAIAVRLNLANPPHLQVVVVAMDPDHPTEEMAMLQMVSNDSGETWSRKPLADGTDGLPQATRDSDPALTFDSYGNLFLAYRAQGGLAVLVMSADGGATWQTVPGFESLPPASGATPKVATGPSGLNSPSGSLWVTLNRRVAEGGGVILAGTQVTGLGPANVRPDWTEPALLPNSTLREVVFSNLTVGPSGEVLASHIIGSGQFRQDAPVTCYSTLDPDGLGTAGITERASFTINAGWEYVPAHGFEIVPIPALGWDHARNRLYVAYGGKETASGEDNDNTDIYVRYSTDAAGTWSDRIKVNDDETGRSQFHAWLAVDQASGNVGVVWYDARHDPANKRTHFYGAISTNGFATAEPDNFQISSEESEVTLASGDHKEYIGAAYFNNWLYPVWQDNSNSTGNNPDGQYNDFDIYVARIRE